MSPSTCGSEAPGSFACLRTRSPIPLSSANDSGSWRGASDARGEADQRSGEGVGAQSRVYEVDRGGLQLANRRTRENARAYLVPGARGGTGLELRRPAIRPSLPLQPGCSRRLWSRWRRRRCAAARSRSTSRPPAASWRGARAASARRSPGASSASSCTKATASRPARRSSRSTARPTRWRCARRRRGWTSRAPSGADRGRPSPRRGAAPQSLLSQQELERLSTSLAVAQAHERAGGRGASRWRSHNLERTLVARALRRLGRAAAGRRGHHRAGAAADDRGRAAGDGRARGARRRSPRASWRSCASAIRRSSTSRACRSRSQTEVSAVERHDRSGDAHLPRADAGAEPRPRAQGGGLRAHRDRAAGEARRGARAARGRSAARTARTRVLVVRDGRADAVPIEARRRLRERGRGARRRCASATTVIVGEAARTIAPGMRVRVVAAAARRPRVMKLADTSIRRPVFAVMLIGGLVVLGVDLDAAARPRPLPARRVPDRHRHHACSRARRPRRSSAR